MHVFVCQVFNGKCCKTGEGKMAVAGLSLCVEEHQILALLGHNGAGKTTTINMLIGLLEPDEGQIKGHLFIYLFIYYYFMYLVGVNSGQFI